MARILTTCTYCGCGCGLFLDSDQGRIVGSYPSGNHPVSKGALCVKGWNAYEFIHRLDRLGVPLMRRRATDKPHPHARRGLTERGDDHFEEVDWDRALNQVCERLLAICRQHGPDSLGFLASAKATNEENFLMMKLARAVFGTNNVDHCARLCHASTVTGLTAAFGSGAMTNSIAEMEDADLFLVTGSDTTAQHPLIGSRIINSVHDRAARLIVVDPRRIELAKYATIYMAQDHGTDVAWINGMMNVILNEGLYDRRFVEERTERFGELCEAIRGYTPERVEAITKIPRDLLVKAARLYASTPKAMILYAMGITQHTTGVNNVKSLANLAMLTGHVGIASAGVNPLRGQNNVQGACDVGALPNVLSGYQAVTDVTVRKMFAEEWNVEHLPSTPGLTVTELLHEAEKGRIKALYIMGENPVVSDPDSDHVRQVLARLDFLVVQDIFVSETALYADVVLPAASFAEKDGTFTSTERRVQRVRKAIEPLGQAKPDWEILCDVARRCGYESMDYRHVSQIMDEIARLTPIYAGITYDRLDPFGLPWPCPSKDHPGTVYLHKDSFPKGKGTFLPCAYAPPDELPDDEYPFVLSTGRVYWHWHTGTMTRRTSTLDREVPTAYVEMHPRDAERLRLVEGDCVAVSSRRGTITIRTLIADRVKEGVVFMPFHFVEAAANVLTNPAVDPSAKIPEYKICAVRVEKVHADGNG